MKCLTLKADNRMDYTTVSNVFIDNFMPQANGEFVKIYLYLLRCISDPGKDISISSIADCFDHTEKDVIRALRYFAGKGLISIEYGPDDELSAVTFLPVNSEFTVISKPAETKVNVVPAPSIVQDKQETNAIPAKPTYTATHIKELTANQDLSELLYITQKYLGKTLTVSETNTIIYLFDTLKFSSELIEYLVEYCVANNHKSMRYIEKVALSWASEGIDTVEKAKENSSLYNSNVFSVMKAFGISGRNPADSEMKLINKWYNEYNFTNDIVLEACNRTIKATHNPSFEYADSILTKWKNNNVTYLADIASIEKPCAPKTMKIFTAKSSNQTNNKFNDFPQRTIDFDLLEKQLMEE